MTTFAAMLRSINVGGRNRVAMEDLRALVASIGYGHVATYLQSGNAIFTGRGGSRKAAKAIEERITADLGLSVPVLARNSSELAGVLASTPYGRLDVDPRTLHVTFLDAAPDPTDVQDLVERADGFGTDRFEVIGTEIYLHCPGGYGETKLNNGYLERRLGVRATTRNWRTVTALAERCGVERPTPQSPV